MPLLKFEGLEDASQRDQLENVFSTLYAFFKILINEQTKSQSWTVFFEELSRCLFSRLLPFKTWTSSAWLIFQAFLETFGIFLP